MINNYILLLPLLIFESPNDFYFLQIIQRRKDFNSVPYIIPESCVIKSYLIYSQQYFEANLSEIIYICNALNSRAYLRLNKRAADIVSLETIKEIANCLRQHSVSTIKDIYLSCCGKHSSDKDKKWIIDVDNKDISLKEDIADFIKTLYVEHHPLSNRRIVAEIPTKNGLHLIVSPFHLDLFKQKFPGIDVHRDNPTLLYCP